jgi:hypothetical protein
MVDRESEDRVTRRATTRDIASPDHRRARTGDQIRESKRRILPPNVSVEDWIPLTLPSPSLSALVGV